MANTKLSDTTWSDETRQAHLSGGQVVYQFHLSGDCLGEHCPVHNPSDHKFRDRELGFEYGYMVRYEDGSHESFIVDPDDYNLNKTGQALLRNSAKCNTCGEELSSEYRHDFVSCSCGNLSVDGGVGPGGYLRRVGTSGNFTDTSIVSHLGDNEFISL